MSQCRFYARLPVTASLRRGEWISGLPQAESPFDVGHFGVNHRKWVAIVVESCALVAKHLAVRSCRGQFIDHDPITVWQMLLWLGRNYAAPKRPIGNEPYLLVIVVACALAIDAPEGIPVNVVCEQLCGYDPVSISGIKAAGDDQ
jgi:hypothetical protein